MVDPFHASPYYVLVAVRKTSERSRRQDKSREPQAAIIFWLIFIISVTGIFLANRETIQKNFSLLARRLSAPPGQEARPPIPDEEKGYDYDADAEPVDEELPPVPPAVRPPPVPEPVAKTQNPAPENPAAQPPRPREQSAQTRDRNLYFIQVDKDGQILRSRVSRKIAVSDSPLYDALNVLLAGPTAGELNRGVISLIPHNTRLLSAVVRGNTAYISFNEAFQFNTYGIEGYAAQLRQIVWTATEFPTVNDVQILIEGRRVDYLGEGIWIGSPINRQSL